MQETFRYVHCEMKVAASTRLDEELMKRAEKIAKRDNRSVANVIELCVLRHLPELEREIMGEDFANQQTVKPRGVKEAA